MLYREIISVCSQIHTKHINTTVWAERRLLPVGVPSDHRDSEVNRGSLKCTPHSHITTRTHYGVTTMIAPCCRCVMTYFAFRLCQSVRGESLHSVVCGPTSADPRLKVIYGGSNYRQFLKSIYTEQYIYHNSINDKWITKFHFPHRISINV